MWACVMKFENGNTSPLYAKSYEGIWQAITDMIRVWKAPVKELHFHRMDSVMEIKQGRVGQYVKAD